MSTSARRRWLPIAIAAASALGIGALGAAMTDLGPWYYALRKPSWQPPDALFGPAWTLIFGLCAIAGVLAWRNARPGDRRKRVVVFFAVNAALNLLWSTLFFRLQRPDWALFEVGLLWLSIVALIVALAPFSRAAGWLLTPYLVWVSFASVLNYAIVRLNGPFK